METLPAFEDTQPIPEGSSKSEAGSTGPGDISAISKSSASLPAFEDTEPPKNEKYSTTGQQVLAGIEGAAQGFAGPVATGVELGLSKLGVPGLSAEDQIARKEANPWTHGVAEVGGMGAGLLTGVGELGLLAKAGSAVVGATKLAEATSVGAKVGAAALKGFVEMGGLQAGNEVTKWLLGQDNPEAPVSSALSSTGFAGLIGAGISGGLGLAGKGAALGLKTLADTRMGTKAAQFLEDFGSRWKFNQENPSVVDSVYKEISDFFSSTADAADEVYGSKGLKAQAIEKLVPKMNEAIQGQNQEIASTLQNKITEMVKDTETYPVRLTKKLMAETNNWMEVATNPKATSYQVFNATQDLKQQLQAYSKFEKAISPLSQEKDFIQVTKELQHKLVNHLEDTDVWGHAGELQKGINKAFMNFLPAQKDFLRRFTTKELGEARIDPQKIKTYVGQLGKTGTDISDEIRPTAMKNYIDAAEKYRSQINDLHAKVGIESPLVPVPLSSIKGTYNEVSPGARLADQMFNGGVGKISGGLSGAALGFAGGHLSQLGYGAETTGASVGRWLGEKFLAPIFENTAGTFIKKTAVPVTLKVLGSGRPTALAEALDHADSIVKGHSTIQMGVNSLFTGSRVWGQHYFDERSEKNKEKIRKFVEEGGLNQQIEDGLRQSTPDQDLTPHFAKGGVVENQKTLQKSPEAASKSEGFGHLGSVYPDHNILMNAAKGRVYNYLNSIRPKKELSPMLFDDDHRDAEHERSYERALDIANKPLSVLKHIQNGTLEPEQVKHMTQMWPEIHNHLAKKITEKMYEGKLKGEKPPFHIRQGLSMFLGSALDSTLTPASIQAVQSTFAVQKAKTQAAMAANMPKKNTSKLGEMSKQYQTTSQAAEARQTAGHS